MTDTELNSTHVDVPVSATLRTGVTAFGCSPDVADVFTEMGTRLGVTPTVTDKATCVATADLARGNRCVSVSHTDRINGSVLRALRRAGVEYISTRSIGYDHIDVERAAAIGISVGNVEYSPGSVGDHTLMLILMALRHANTILRCVDAHDYRLCGLGRELGDLTVGVIGMGRIGRAVVQRLRAFDCRVLVHDIRPGATADHVSLDQLLRRSDVVTLHTPLTPRTHHLIDRRRLESMKTGAYIVNTGRGSLLDTEALLSALEYGRLGGAALDVIEGEESDFYIDRRNTHVENDFLLRLQRMPNVTITPHSAFHTDRAVRDMVVNSLTNCVEFDREGTQWAG